MESYTLTITLQSAFGTPLLGDTLFGQLCWAVRNRLGEDRLNKLLTGYTGGKPFAVISDAFPIGFIPLPKLPGAFYQMVDGADRKAVKKRAWLPVAALVKPLTEWLNCAVTSSQIAMTYPGDAQNKKYPRLSEKHPRAHNSINSLTGTTGEDGFAPYSMEQEWFIPGLQWTIYLLLDTDRLSLDDCRQCLTDIGAFGFGKDASIGLGKFTIESFHAEGLPAQANANACLTLAPCAPQGLGFEQSRSFYQLFTRFGRHGDIAVHQQGKPFKNPLLLTKAGAIFGVQPPISGFIGQGIGDNGRLSKTLPETVQQGYSPIIPIHLSEQSAQELI
jgi:CRISPR-associated protein Csm4